MLTTLLLRGLTAVATSTLLPAQVLLAINTASGSSSALCSPVTCAPDPVDMPAAFPYLQVVVAGGGFTSGFLLMAVPPAQCVALPGFGGTLNLQPPGVVTVITPTWGHFPSAPCVGWQGLHTQLLPPGIPPGFQFLVQVMFEAPTWTFSNAVQVTVQ